MKLAGIIFLIAIIIYFLRSLRKNKDKGIDEKKIEPKKGEEKKERNGNESKNKIWKKKSAYVWLFILQFVVLNFIYPGGWFEVKAIFWFFATRNSDKYVALKDINTILEKDGKQKISSVRAEIKKIEGKTKLTENDKRRLDELTNEVANVGKPTPPPQKTFAKPKEVWIFGWTATDELMNEDHQQKPYSEYVANDVTHSKKELSFICFKGKRQEDKIVLTREDEKQAYVGYLFNKIKKEYTPIWLLPENDGYKGYIFANNGPKIIATLKKQKGQNQ